MLRACKGTSQCCMDVCVCACVHECMCTCQCCTPACVRVLRVCMCTCGVRLHVSRLTFSSLLIRFSSRWIRNQGPPVYHQTPPPIPLSRQPPPAEPPAPAARGRPSLPETTPHRRSAAAPPIPLAPPADCVCGVVGTSFLVVVGEHEDSWVGSILRHI